MIDTNNVSYVLTHNKKENDDNISYVCFGIDGRNSCGQSMVSVEDISLEKTDVEYLINRLNDSNTRAEEVFDVCRSFVDLLHIA